MTAAHCLTFNTEMTAYFGKDPRENLTQSGWSIPLSNQYIYPGYNETELTHDIAVLELPRSHPLSEYVQPAKLRQMNDATVVSANLKVIAAGIGYGKLNDTILDYVLRHASLDTFPSETCAFHLYYRFDPNSIICTFKDLATGQATHGGDSGKLGLSHGRFTNDLSF